MQRKKTFLVVCISIVIMGITQAQNIPPSSYPGASGLTVPTIPGGFPDPSFIRMPVSHIAIPAWNAGLYWGQMTAAPDRSLLSADNASLFPGSTGALGDKIARPGNTATAADKTAKPSPRALENDYYTRHFGFFCQKELEFEKTTRIPLRFRLGSLEQCNYLEGKK